MIGLADMLLHLDQQIGAAGNQARFSFAALQQCYGVIERYRFKVFKISHQSSLKIHRATAARIRDESGHVEPRDTVIGRADCAITKKAVVLA
ncbi:hypothetical protein ACFS07_11400 [Undibacterium arcticum]